jgi:SpoIID/LytB domain protein
MKLTGVAGILIGASVLFGQPLPADADLERASGGRVIAVRGLNGGAVARVPLEIYVARVLAGEGEPAAPEATQDALAIAIRTFAIFNAGRHRQDGFDLCDSTHCQVPRAATAASRRAALATAGRILTYQGAPAEIFYSASCGGRSESASEVWPRSNLPYLRSVEDDVHDDDAPWTVELPLEDVQRALRRSGFEGSLKNVEVDSRSDSGRAARLELSGMRPDVIAGEQFRAAVGTLTLRSTAFAVTRRGGTLRFTGRGFGHGVGMCVVGAGRRARRGESTERILAKYYPGLAVSRLADVPETSTARRVAVAPAAPAAASRGGVTVRVPPNSSIAAEDLQRVADRTHAALARTLGVPAAAIDVHLHDTLDSFRAATGSSWWVSGVASSSSIDLAPVAALVQRGGVEPALRVAIAESLIAPALAERPAWVRVGGARYFARSLEGRPPPPASRQRVRCPADAELTFAISAGAQREAESRAEACFARAYAQTKDWRAVR